MASEVSQAHELRKIGNVLALLLVKDANKTSQIRTLNICGYSNAEIAALTGLSEVSVLATLSQQRRSPGKVGSTGGA